MLTGLNKITSLTRDLVKLLQGLADLQHTNRAFASSLIHSLHALSSGLSLLRAEIIRHGRHLVASLGATHSCVPSLADSAGGQNSGK